MDTYIVKSGDTLEKIADMYNIPAIELIKANNLVMPYLLKENDVLNIPTVQANIFDYYTVVQNDTLYNIAKMKKTTVGIVASINGLNEDDYIYPGQTLLIPKEGILTYITTSGDTINSVASYFNTYPQDVLYSNNNIYLLPEQLIIYRKIQAICFFLIFVL